MIETFHRSMLAHGSDYFIPFEMYSKGCFVICVNTNRGSRESSIAVEKRGNMEIKLSLSEPLANNQILHIMGVLDSTFEIDGDRNVTTNYQY